MTRSHRPSRRSVLAGAVAASLASSRLLGADPAPATQPQRKPGTRKEIPPKMSFIANDEMKLGMDLSVGGAITHLSPAKEPQKNLVNSWDLGRQIQMSYYSGPVPYEVPGHAGPPPQWKHIGWNPIQVGDDFGNPAKILEHRNDGRELYVKCIPMQWPLDDVPGECTFECWAKLEGPAARIRSRLTMNRADKTQYPARGQELPAVYTNAPWYKLMTYTGDKPFDDGELTQIKHPFTSQSPWAMWNGTERWAAQVDANDWGLGVWNPSVVRFGGGFCGTPGKSTGGPKDGATGYIAPHREEILDHNLVHEYSYALVLGELKAIRTWVYAQPRLIDPPKWSFEKDRQGWIYRNATDAGWPVLGELNIDCSGSNPQIISPVSTWRANDAPKLKLEAAFSGNVSRANIYFATNAEPRFSPKRVLGIDVKGDGEMRAYGADLGSTQGYSGLITQVRIDPLPAGNKGDRVRVKAVKFGLT
jgi:hypothetical protein